MKKSVLRASVSLWVFLLCVLSGSVVNSQPPELILRVGFAKPGGGYTVTPLSLETYVARVLAGEAARESPPAALEALAITIRTYALANRDRHRSDGFDMCDDTHCQVLRAATAATERAARATAGQVLTRNGLVASVYYSASCGGRTEIPSDVWPGAEDPSYLPARDDEACDGAPAWQSELTDRDLERSLRAAGFRGERLRELRVQSRNQSGRVAMLTVNGLTPGQISGQDLRVAVGRTLGWQHIKSTAFELRRQRGTYRFSGHGFGHGVGLCVIGSVNLAAHGTSAAAILSKYFPGLNITIAGPRMAADPPRVVAAPPAAPPPLPARETVREPVADVVTRGSDVLLSLPEGDEGERRVISALTMRTRDDVARVLGVTPPAKLSMRFHPTIDAYSRATSQPWFTSGAIVNAELHMPPLTVLRERGVLERAVRHELVRMMTGDALAKRPEWVREGAALYFAGEPPVPGEPAPSGPSLRPAPAPRGPCPSDNELLHPVSVGALADAHARARACFARQADAGKSWRDIK